jgi:CII-binding regulator of phage lambda lysogenization HflD
MNWLDALNSKLTQTRESTRARVTAVADSLTAEVERLTLANTILQSRLEESEHMVNQLLQKIALLER